MEEIGWSHKWENLTWYISIFYSSRQIWCISEGYLVWTEKDEENVLLDKLNF